MESTPTQSTFNAAFGLRTSQPFADQAFRGFHDGAKGVQWHIAEELSTGMVYVAVNLEGLKYGSERPIRKFLHREKSRPLVPDLCRRCDRATELYAHVIREGWPGPRTRVALRNREILRTNGGTLRDDDWIQAMSAALGCLSSEGERGTQSVTRIESSQSEIMNVLPHVTIGLPVWRGSIPTDAVPRVQSAMSSLRDIYDAFCERVAAY
jgi:hypothetical protein